MVAIVVDISAFDARSTIKLINQFGLFLVSSYSHLEDLLARPRIHVLILTEVPIVFEAAPPSLDH